MATTPNYGWVTPAPTDFVVDLPADFEIFADAVDADLAGLLGGTTGQVLKKNSATDHDFAWAVDPTTDVVTTAGDLIYGTAADTVTRLGIGTAGQVLTVNAGATAPQWTTVNVNAQTSLATGSFAVGTTNITSISGSYNDLILICNNFDPATDAAYQTIRFNADTGSNYYSAAFGSTTGVAAATFGAVGAEVDNTATSRTYTWIYIPQYANTSNHKFYYAFSGGVNATTTSQRSFFSYMGLWSSTAAITQINLLASSGNTDAGTYTLLGVK